MRTEPPYKVLWVDDDESIVAATRLDAEDYNIELEHFTNWQEAEHSLKKNFQEYSAIILDANCKILPESLEEEEFISSILPSLKETCGKMGQDIPWYILSAGTMANFERTVRAAKYQHSPYESEWGDMLYLKDAVDDSPQSSSKLFENIQRVAKDKSVNVILHRHSDVFAILGEDKLIDARARKLMLRMLRALYYPEENIKYEPIGNHLRKVLEYMFRSARKLGLLSKYCFDKNDHINLLDASRFMAGIDVKYKRGKNDDYVIRWGKAGDQNEGKGGDKIFPEDVATIVKNIINYSGAESHTQEILEDEPYFFEEEKKEQFFGYAMQLCYVLRWYGKYAQEHNNKETNLAMHKLEPSKSKIKTPEPLFNSSPVNKADIIGKEFIVCQDEKFLFAGSCKISAELKSIVKPFSKVRILDVEDNKDEQSGRYPYIATNVENLQQ